MPVIVIVGGQYGSEGKGKVAHYFAKVRRATIAIRVGGPNSGHTVIGNDGTPVIFRALPTAAILDNVVCVLGAGSYIDVDVLLSEIEISRISHERIWIDPNAYVVTDDHKRQERESGLGERIGSTQSGTGAAVAERVARLSRLHLAQHDKRLSRFVKPVRPLLRSHLGRGEKVIIEGTQGFGLSLLHSPHYPKATSRDTIAAAFVAESGLSPIDVTEVVLVIRAFPIRVAGDSGLLLHQTDWETVAREGGWTSALIEYTSVTNRIRRVARFDPIIVKAAIEANTPTSIVLNHVDYVDATCVMEGRPTERIEAFVRQVERTIDTRIDYIGLGRSSIIPRSSNTISSTFSQSSSDRPARKISGG